MSGAIQNLLLAGLPIRERNAVLRHCEAVQLQFGCLLCEVNQPMHYLYFPLTASISQVITLRGHKPLELGLIGNEGMLGVTLILGIETAPSRAVVQGAGSALRISIEALHEELLARPRLMRRLKCYLYVLQVQLSQNVACGHFHALEPRLARLLLMTHDRAHTDHFHLTHQYLANMLGVRRSGVTIAAGALQLRGLIHYCRGEIGIIDRARLEAAACECYAEMQDEYSRQFSLPLRDLA
ncbi:Crp/Fnr family transcriptional regulator [Ectopseudomonas khazarica]|uniref:Crp/Fnr family transcriptional regulator n=1 Tax=Ectopseudomonas khazarica TaxID=2502979 RepID=UPI001AF00791|nr:Crp/Fnr family transcriptional regulator [Pseudomonas khazarica]QTS84311.1 Crp/Fnr family transcriptional regulator [Pseudomonas khazarica]